MERATIDAVLKEAVDAGLVPGLVAAVTDARDVRFEAAYGRARFESGVPMSVDSVFRIASMTKAVTALGFMMLVEDGLLDLDAPFGRYFPRFVQPPVLASFDPRTGACSTRPARAPVTLRQLLAHTSGFGYWFLSPALRAQLRGDPDYFDAPFLLHEPGERFTYGIGADVAGQAIEPVTDMPLAEFFARRLFEPLGMRDTGWALPPADRLVGLHQRTESSFTERPLETAAETPRAGGALYSTARDYLRVLRLLLNRGRVDGERLLAPESCAAIVSNQIGPLVAERQRSAAPDRTNDFAFMDGSQKFGLGVLVETRDRPGMRSAGSFGWAGIFNTYFWADPAAGIAAVLLTQSSPFADAATLGLWERFERAVYRALR
ncbi:MAG TPA: serine hydrolase domain-containing protein [Gammaproteobacteria bacterium]